MLSVSIVDSVIFTEPSYYNANLQQIFHSKVKSVDFFSEFSGEFLYQLAICTLFEFVGLAFCVSGNQVKASAIFDNMLICKYNGVNICVSGGEVLILQSVKRKILIKISHI